MPNLNYQDLTSVSYIDLIGSGVSQFLTGQLTINADRVNSKTAKLAAFCSHKGRINSLFHIVAIENGFRLIMPKCIIESSIAQIKKYSVFFKLRILVNENRTISATLKKTDSSDQAIKIASTDLSVKIGEALVEKTPPAEDVPIAGDDFWYWHLAEKRIPWLSPAAIGHFLPHSLNLHNLEAIDFNKGCFTGQEVIARMQYKATLKQHMQPLYTPNGGDVMSLMGLSQHEKKVAEIVCSANHPEHGCLALALVKDSADKNKDFQLKLENASILELRVCK